MRHTTLTRNGSTPRRRQCTARGFTLVELIVVIAILAILALILVPTMTGLLKDSREAVCLANRDTVQRAYVYAYTQSLVKNKAMDTDAMLNLALQEAGEKATATGGRYHAHCGGDLTVVFDGDGQMHSITCSLHGGEGGTPVIGKMYNDNGTERSPVALLLEQRKALTDISFNIDSAAPDKRKDDSSSGKKELLDKLQQTYGFQMSEYAVETWAINSDKNNLSAFFTNKDIQALDAGAEVYVIRYSQKTDTYTIGTMQVATMKEPATWKMEYNRLDISKGFTPLEGDEGTAASYQEAAKKLLTLETA